MKNIQDKFFQLLRLAIGASDTIPFIKREEWADIYEMARKQSLLGVAFDGVQKMSDAAKEKGESMEMDVDLLMTWMGKCKQIEKRNGQLNEAVNKVSKWFLKKGFHSCILKGQGNALLYPNPLHRTPGDIDIWVSGKPGEVIRFVHSIAPDEKASYHHIDFPAINGIPVEVHYRPCYLQNLVHNHRLQRWFRQQAERQFSHLVGIGEDQSSHQVRIGVGQVAVPTHEFNAVYQLVHIYNHLFQEGIGLRQIIDYYFVVCHFNKVYQNFSNPSVSLSKGSSTFSPSPYPLRFPRARGTETSGSGDVTAPPRRSEPLRSKVGGPSKVSPGSAGWDRLAIEGDCSAVLQGELKCLGLWKFAGAVMYVLHEVLGLSEAQMIAPMDSKRGKLLLREILIGGNFGQHDSRHHFGHGAMGHNLQRLCRDFRLVRYYPAEALSEPVFRAWHFCWRMWQKVKS